MEDYMQELKGQQIWMLWRFEIRKEKRTKVPRSALDGGPSGSDESWSHTWVTYDEAVYARDTYGMDGVGFKIPDGYFFLDVDHRELDDHLVQKLLTRFDSYAERSVSGGGIHIYGRCDASLIPTSTDANGRVKLDRAYYMKNPHNGVELYYGGITNRFAVFTGNVIWGKPLRDCTEALLATLDEDMRRQEKPAEKKLAKSHDAVFDVVGNLLRQGNADKFRKLYQDGDFSDYGSQSEADCALCAMIAFRTGPDPDMIDRVFRASALMREKWEREDYREATIQKGIEACNGTFHRSKMEHPYFIRFNDDGEAYVVPALLARYVRENVKYLLVRDSGKQALLKYVYDGGVYKLYAEDMFKGVIKGFVEEYDPELVKMRVITEAYQQIITDLQYIGQEELDACETLINFSNCLLRVDARGMTTVPHTPSIYSTIQIPCRWTGKPSPTPVFDRYLHTLTNGDKAVEQLLLEFIGACISNVKGWRMKKALFLVGAGDTGKSQLKSLVERLLGKENFIGIDLKEIEARFGTGVIYGTRLAGSSDMSFLTVDELKTFKKITGGDSLFAEFKGQQGFQYTYNGLLWFCMNRLPKFGGDDGQWVYNRIMVVDCPNVIPLEKQDKELLDKMYAERDGIVFKAITALQTVITNGYRFSEPESVTAARQKYKDTNSTVVSFFEECMCLWPQGKIVRHCTTGRIYKVYQAWCRENNNGFAKTAREFREDLAEHLGAGFADITTRQKGNTYYKEYTLTLEAKEMYAREYGYDGAEFL
jgi:P4 family phage/plasmid primase-like protien